MPSYLRIVIPALMLAILGACRPEASEPEGGGTPADSAAPQVTAAPTDAGAPAADTASKADQPAEAASVVIRYEHFRTCTRFMGRAGQFFAVRMIDIENRGTIPFEFQSERLRIADAGGTLAAPAFMVPELTNLEGVPTGATQPADLLFLLERAGQGPPPRGPVQLGYDEPGVRMVVGGAPAYDEGSGCDEFNT